MKVLIVNDYLRRVGGAQVHDRYLARKLEDRGHSVQYFGGRDRGTIRNFFSGWYSRYDVNSLRDSLAWIPDVVFSHSLGETISPYLFKIFSRLGVPCAFKIPDLSTFSYNGFSARHPLELVENPRIYSHRRWIRKHVDLLLCPSASTSEWASNQFPEVPRIVHRNPVTFELADQPNVSPSKKCVLYVGRLHEDKGLRVLLRALSRLPTTDWTVSIVGDGPQRAELVSLAEDLQISPHVRFQGHLDPEEVIERYRQASVTVLPSVVPETFGLTLLESMGQGTPCITTNIGGQRELVDHGKTGYLVPPGDPDVLCDRIAELLRSPETRLAMGSAALDYVEEYDSKDQVGQLENIFEDLS